MECSNCGAENREGIKFCTECGQSLTSNAPKVADRTIACSKCKAENREGIKFCTECGQSLTSNVPKVADRTIACSKCKAENRVEVKFCTNCGTNLSQPIQVEEAVTETVPPPETQPTSKPEPELFTENLVQPVTEAQPPPNPTTPPKEKKKLHRQRNQRSQPYRNLPYAKLLTPHRPVTHRHRVHPNRPSPDRNPVGPANPIPNGNLISLLQRWEEDYIFGPSYLRSPEPLPDALYFSSGAGYYYCQFGLYFLGLELFTFFLNRLAYLAGEWMPLPV